MSITGGSVTFEQSRKLADYENRKAAVTFNVNEPDGDDATEQCRKALDLAGTFVLTALGLKKPEPTKTAPLTGEVIEPAKTRGRPPKRPPVVVGTVEQAAVTLAKDAVSVADVADVGENTPAISTGEERIDPANPEDTSAAAVTDESLFEPAVVEITDTVLLSHITRKNAELQKVIGPQAPPKIRTLIGKYVSAPKQARDMPQEVRAKFIEELGNLSA